MDSVFISDLHIKRADDSAAKLLREFFLHSHTLHADKVFLLGDIFDHLIGDHPEFLKKYAFFFEGIEKLLELDKEVVFIEGNHDFHFKRIMDKYFSGNSRYSQNFRYLRSGETIVFGEKKYLFCHGYEVDYFNKYFKRWHKVYTSKWFYFLVTHILSFSMLNKLADWASKDSKRRGSKTFDIEMARAKYIEGAYELIKSNKLDGVIAGHTHIFANHTYPEGQRYFNCGFPLRDKKFLSIRNNEFEMISLEGS